MLIPHGPLLDFIRKLITSPEEAARDVSVRYRESGVESWVEQSHAAPHGYATSGSGLDGFFSSALAGNETTDTSGEPSSSASVPRSESSVPVSGPELSATNNWSPDWTPDDEEYGEDDDYTDTTPYNSRPTSATSSRSPYSSAPVSGPEVVAPSALVPGSESSSESSTSGSRSRRGNDTVRCPHFSIDDDSGNSQLPPVPESPD